MLGLGESLGPVVSVTVRQNRRAIGDSDIHGGREREDIDDDDGIADWRKCQDSRQAPLALEFVVPLVEMHANRVRDSRGVRQPSGLGTKPRRETIGLAANRVS